MPWVVARTLPRQERAAEERVRRQDHDTYLPILRNANGSEEALFRGYLFVQVVHRWRHLQNTKGILHVVSFGDAPALLHHSIIRALREREVDGCIELPKASRTSRFHRGQKVRITSGPFEGELALYEGMDSLERERVLLNVFGRKTPISVDTGSLSEVA